MAVVRAQDLAYRRLPGRRSADPFLGRPEGVSVRVVRLDPDVPRSPHRHPHSPEVIYVVEGSGTAWLDGTATPVGPGDVVLVPAGVAHATLCDPGTQMRLVCFFPHADLRHNLEELSETVLSPDGPGNRLSGPADHRTGD